jgi:hypothetical protein
MMLLAKQNSRISTVSCVPKLIICATITVGDSVTLRHHPCTPALYKRAPRYLDRHYHTYSQFRFSTETIADEYASSLVSSFFGLGIEHTLKPLQADLGVGVSCCGARIVPSGSRVSGPVRSMG